MKYTTTFPMGGKSPIKEPISITAAFKTLKGHSIQGRTWGQDGCQITLLDEHGRVMGQYNYSYIKNGPGHHKVMAKDVVSDINIILELAKKKSRMQVIQLEPIMKEVFRKCESRYGRRLPDSEYEARVVFE